jgi:MoxR-like ATPase
MPFVLTTHGCSLSSLPRMELSEALAGRDKAPTSQNAMAPFSKWVAERLGGPQERVNTVRIGTNGAVRSRMRQQGAQHATVLVVVLASDAYLDEVRRLAPEYLGERADRKAVIVAIVPLEGRSVDRWTIFEPEEGTIAQRLGTQDGPVEREVIVPHSKDDGHELFGDGAVDPPTVVVLPVDHQRLVIDERIRRMLRLAIASSRAVMLIGPPGTGKTTLLLEAFQEAQEDPASYGLVAAPQAMPLVVTPEEGWTSRELVGGETVDDEGNLRFKPGYVLDAVRENTWLILDEANRADMDRIFGGLLTFLSGRAVTLGRAAGTSDAATIRLEPSDQATSTVVNADGLVDGTGEAIVYRAGRDWKLLGTYNALDAHRVFRFGQALGRRFARVPVPAIDLDQFREALEPRLVQLVEAHSDVDGARVRTVIEGLYKAHLDLLQPVVGPALFLAIPGYVTSGLSLGGDVDLEQLLVEGYLLGAGPLLAQLEPKTRETFKARVVTAEKLIGGDQWTFLASLLSTLT